MAMKGKDQDCVIKIEAALYQELLICASLLPLAVVELRADYNPDVFAVDASDWGEAVTSCPTTSAFTKELSRHALRKGVWTRLLAPAAARARSHGNLDPDRELPGGEEARFRSHPLWTTVFRVGKFGVAWKRGTPRRRHINIGELRAFLHAEKAGKLRGKASRVLIGGDSQVALRCMLKGRSVSRSLNLELQKSLGFILGGGVQSYLMYCPTKLNPADDPTRGAAVREPSLPEPSWWASALLGDFALLDQWKSDPLSLSGIPDLEELSRAGPREMENHIAKAHLKSCKRLRDVLNAPRNLTDHPDFPSSTATVRDWPKEAIEASKLTGSVVFPKGASRSECSARSGYIDLFSGSGGVCRELCRLTGRWVVSYDIIHGSSEDLLKPVVQDEVLSLIDSGAILGVGAAPVCSSMSRAITPSWRSAAEPYGIVGLTQAQQKKVSEGNEFAKFVAKVCAACLRRSIPFWVENPVASFLWWIPEVVSISRSPGVGFWTVDFCAFGTPWRKRTRFLTTTCLAGQKTLCPGCLAHQILRGRSRQHKKSWTRVAEPYPNRLSLVVAMALSGASGDRPEFNKLDASKCAKCGCMRIGEASNPGPRRSNAHDRAERRRNLVLQDVPLVGRQTVLLEAKLWEGFRNWLLEDCSAEALDDLLKSSAAMGPLLELYGEYLFKTGASLNSFRHLITFAQRTFGDFKLYSKGCWELVTKWELTEPLVHRPPLPLRICEAMAGVALTWAWPRFALVLLLASTGILRIGEVLAAVRADLVLPVDLLSNDYSKAFLRVPKPKTGRRGGGKQQHATVRDERLIRACARVFCNLEREQKLFPFSSNLPETLE